MPTLPPSQFIEQAHAKGFVFSVKPGGDELGVKPPPGGSLTDPMRRYIGVMKSELIALIQSPGQVKAPAQAPPVVPALPPAPAPAARPAPAATPRRFVFSRRDAERIAAEKFVMGIATLKIPWAWPTQDAQGRELAPVQVSPGVATLYPLDWLIEGWRRYCETWHRATAQADEFEGNPTLHQRWANDADILLAELLNVIEQGVKVEPDPAKDPYPCGPDGCRTPEELERYRPWVFAEQARLRCGIGDLSNMSEESAAELRALAVD